LDSLYYLIPLALLLLAGAIWAFVWSVRSGQFEDMEGPAYRILMDDDDPNIPEDARIRQAPDSGSGKPVTKPDKT
jgi:cbb3-type cytochrome oxidase maturation protein